MFPVDESLITLSQAARRFPGHQGANRMHPSTIARWILTGAKSLGGARVKLEAVRVGGRWLTTEAALGRFADMLSAHEEVPASPTRAETRSCDARPQRQQFRA